MVKRVCNISLYLVVCLLSFLMTGVVIILLEFNDILTNSPNKNHAVNTFDEMYIELFCAKQKVWNSHHLHRLSAHSVDIETLMWLLTQPW